MDVEEPAAAWKRMSICICNGSHIDAPWSSELGLRNTCASMVTRKCTFICRPYNTLHHCLPMHDIVVRRAEFEKRFVWVGLIGLELFHEPLYG